MECATTETYQLYVNNITNVELFCSILNSRYITVMRIRRLEKTRPFIVIRQKNLMTLKRN